MTRAQSEFDRATEEIAAARSAAHLRALRAYVHARFADDLRLADLDRRIDQRQGVVASVHALVASVHAAPRDDFPGGRLVGPTQDRLVAEALGWITRGDHWIRPDGAAVRDLPRFTEDMQAIWPEFEALTPRGFAGSLEYRADAPLEQRWRARLVFRGNAATLTALGETAPEAVATAVYAGTGLLEIERERGTDHPEWTDAEWREAVERATRGGDESDAPSAKVLPFRQRGQPDA
jgi:hypothetical protein